MHGGGSLTHPEQPKALPFFSESRPIWIEADPVIRNLQLNASVRFRQVNGDVVGVRVPLDIAQSFLEDAVEGQFGFGGQAFLHCRAVHPERHARPFHKFRVRLLEGGNQAQFFQFVGP
jgi:hypothetical protein